MDTGHANLDTLRWVSPSEQPASSDTKIKTTAQRKAETECWRVGKIHKDVTSMDEYVYFEPRVPFEGGPAVEKILIGDIERMNRMQYVIEAGHSLRQSEQKSDEQNARVTKTHKESWDNFRKYIDEHLDEPAKNDEHAEEQIRKLMAGVHSHLSAYKDSHAPSARASKIDRLRRAKDHGVKQHTTATSFPSGTGSNASPTQPGELENKEQKGSHDGPHEPTEEHKEHTDITIVESES